MEVKGRKVQPPKPLDIIFPRVDDEPIHFRMQPVLSEEAFVKACPEPTPPMTGKPGEKMQANTKDEGYRNALREYNDKHLCFVMLTALKPTEGLKFDGVALEDPSTWSWKAMYGEMIASGMTDSEVSHLLKKYGQVNQADEEHLEEARKRFLQQEAGRKG